MDSNNLGLSQSFEIHSFVIFVGINENDPIRILLVFGDPLKFIFIIRFKLLNFIDEVFNAFLLGSFGVVALPFKNSVFS